jgi:hypothetical protein
VGEADARGFVVAVVGEPSFQQAVIELRMELQGERPAEHERL